MSIPLPPKCTVRCPEEPEIECDWVEGHDRMKYNGNLYDHSHPAKGVWWNMGAYSDRYPVLCGAKSPSGVMCDFPKGHGPLYQGEKQWEHGNTKGKQYWPNLSEPITKGVWGDLEHRLRSAAHALSLLADTALDPAEIKRLNAKAEGVRLAISYMEDYRT